MPYELVPESSSKYEVVPEGTLSPKAQAGVDAVLKNGWGTGYPKMAYNLGGSITDLLSKSETLRGAPAASAGYIANVLTNAIPSFLTAVKGVPGQSEDQISSNALNLQKQKVLDAGREVGLKVPPSQVNPSFLNRLIESVGGKAATAQQASAVNQDTAYAIAQREAGLKPNESLNLDTLKAARDRLSQPYRDIAALPSKGPLSEPPFKSPADTLEELKSARSSAKELWNYYGRSMKPDVLQQAKAASARADQLEQFLEAQASAAGKPELAQSLRDARMALAKNFTVERAMKGSSFDPAALSRLASRGNTPLSGDLETLMRMQRDFPKAMAAPQVGGSVGVNQLLPWLGGGAGAAAGSAMGPGGAAMGGMAGAVAAQALPPVARALMLSGPYQNLMANFAIGTGGTPALAPFLSNPSITGALYQ